MKYTYIQILRGFAALSVVLYHMRTYLNINHIPNTIFSPFNEMFSSAVLVFFCISGFLMAYLIDTGYKNFLINRLIRIYPTFLLFVVVTILAKVLIFSSITTPNLILAITLLPVGNISYPLGVEWSLIYEVFFYFICAAFTVSWLKKYYPFFLTFWFLVIIIAIDIFNVPTLLKPTIDIIAFSSFNLFFISGSAIYYVSKRKSPFNGKIIYPCILIGCILFTWVFYEYIIQTGIASLHKQIILVIVFGLLVLSIIRIEQTMPVKSKILTFLEKYGDNSYALYLIHVPVITILLSVTIHFLKLPVNSYISVMIFLSALIIGWYAGQVDNWLHKLLKTVITQRLSGLLNRNLNSLTYK